MVVEGTCEYKTGFASIIQMLALRSLILDSSVATTTDRGRGPHRLRQVPSVRMVRRWQVLCVHARGQAFRYRLVNLQRHTHRRPLTWPLRPSRPPRQLILGLEKRALQQPQRPGLRLTQCRRLHPKPRHVANLFVPYDVVLCGVWAFSFSL